MITIEETEKIITDLFVNDYDYFSPFGLYHNDVTGKRNDKILDYHFNKVFPNLNKKNGNLFMRYDIADKIFLIADGSDNQFYLNLCYHGVAINLYKYFSKNSFYGFLFQDFFDKINLNDFTSISRYGYNFNNSHQTIHKHGSDTECLEFFKLITPNNTLVINSVFMHDILGLERWFNFRDDIFEILKVENIVYKSYVHGFTERFKIPSTLKSVSFDLKKDVYNSILEQKTRIITQDKKIIPYILKSTITSIFEKNEINTIKENIQDIEDYETDIILSYDNNKGVVITNMYAYNNLKKDLNKDILKLIKIIHFKNNKEFNTLKKYFPDNIGDISWWNKKYNTIPKGY